MANTARIVVNVYDGARRLFANDAKWLLRILDGDHRPLVVEEITGPAAVKDVPFSDNFRDDYTVIASAERHVQAGFFPVKVSPRIVRPVSLMLLPREPRFVFRDAQWSQLQQSDPKLYELLSQGAADRDAAEDRYTQLMEDRPEALAGLFNILTAMRQIHLPNDSPSGARLPDSPFDYLRQLIWDADHIKPDRFFAWADRSLVDQVRLAAELQQFVAEPSPGVLHKGATRSWKEVRFGEANVQLTFHENDHAPDKADWVLVEPDIDYFKDPAAHFLLEVLPGFFSISDPKTVYVLRWIAGRQAGVPQFNPPFTIEAQI
jgi:hypothetical protein